jgi:hypothetical protein
MEIDYGARLARRSMSSAARPGSAVSPRHRQQPRLCLFGRANRRFHGHIAVVFFPRPSFLGPCGTPRTLSGCGGVWRFRAVVMQRPRCAFKLTTFVALPIRTDFLCYVYRTETKCTRGRVTFRKLVPAKRAPPSATFNASTITIPTARKSHSTVVRVARASGTKSTMGPYQSKLSVLYQERRIINVASIDPQTATS